jgi:ubiquinone/menaquinone biosynthesis C-methylase UbiE
LDWKAYEGQDYERFWVGPGKKYLDELEHLVVGQCLAGGEAIADIGAGFGRLANCYVGKYRQVNLVEPASNLRQIAQRTYGDKAQYYDASVTALPFGPSSLDAVLMIRVLHHLGDPTDALCEINRVLKPGGKLVFNYSNKRNLKRIIQWLIRRAPNPFGRNIEPYSHVLFGHHPAYVDEVLAKAGFRIIAEFGTGVMDKLVDAFPGLGRVCKPSLRRARLMGKVRLAPSQFLVAQKV